MLRVLTRIDKSWIQIKMKEDEQKDEVKVE